MEKAPASVM